MIKKILCPTDGSEHADKAIDLASDLAAKYGAELVLMHVLMSSAAPEDLKRFAEVEGLAKDVKSEMERLLDLQRSVLAASAPVPSRGVSREVVENIGKHALEQARQRAESKGVKKVTERIDDGDPGKRIVHAAESEGVDTIVMGSRGLGDLKGLFLGSVSHYVASRAHCTCITVK
ncbi:MAG: universal stress protein [Gammaproteobacteria bacterium]|nr:universal stress protein [Gammaproteobacteria bacterium]